MHDAFSLGPITHALSRSVAQRALDRHAMTPRERMCGNCGSAAYVHDTERIYGSGNVGLQIECYDYATLTNARATISPIYGGIEAPDVPPEDE